MEISPSVRYTLSLEFLAPFQPVVRSEIPVQGEGSA